MYNHFQKVKFDKNAVTKLLEINSTHVIIKQKV